MSSVRDKLWRRLAAGAGVIPACDRELMYEAKEELEKQKAEIERLKAENVAIKATALEIFSPNCEHHTGENTLPWDEFVARTSKVCMLCALDVITRQADEIEQLRAYSAAYNTLLAERVEIECLRCLAIRAWHSFRSGLSATGGCRDGLTDGDILELVRLSNTEAAKNLERDVLHDCRQGKQRCHECPDTGCCDNES